MVYCYRCGNDNPENAKYCNMCAATLSGDRRFEDDVKMFAHDVSKMGREVGKTAADLGKKVAKEAKAFADEVGKKVAPKPLDCPSCKTKIYDTDEYCYKCGNKME
jgi:predicted amidophosphoribosyltransferase